MKKIIFSCSENMNRHKEEMEFDDDATDEEINDEFVTWVWQEVGDHYAWYVEGE